MTGSFKERSNKYKLFKYLMGNVSFPTVRLSCHFVCEMRNLTFVMDVLLVSKNIGSQ